MRLPQYIAIFLNGELESNFSSKFISVKIRMRWMVGHDLFSVRRIIIRRNYNRQWSNLSYSPEKQPFQKLFYEHFPRKFGCCGYFNGCVCDAGWDDVLYELQSTVSEYCWLIGSLRYFVFPATKLNLLAITYDRYTAVMSPLKYNVKINLKKVISILSLVWTFPMILTLSRLVWWIKLPQHQALYADRIFNTCLIFSLVTLPVAVLLVANLRIVLEIRKQHRRVNTMDNASVTETCSSSNNASNKHRRKTSRQAGRKGTTACVLVVFIFVMCWFPRGLYNIFRLFGKEEGPLLRELSLFFLFVQSAINPFVYSFYRTDFRRALVRLLRCR